MKYAIALIGLLASPAVAQEGPAKFSLPAGCTAYLTTQLANCTVDHQFTCDGDPSGHQRRVSLDERGMVYMGVIDNETQWINSFHPLTGHSETLEAEPLERASLSDLIANGVDEYDFQTQSDQIGVTRYVGRDRLTGRQVKIDGITLDETEYNITAYDEAGDEIWKSQGKEFISRDWRMFLSGNGTVTTPDGGFHERAESPVEFIFPGEAGFLSARPKHGCGLAVS